MLRATMRHALRLGFAAIGLGLSLPSPASAQTAPPPVVTQAPPAVSESTPSAPAAGNDGAPSAATTLRVFADQEHAGRIAGAIGGLVIGAGLVSAGLVADVEYDKSYGQTVWAVGIGTMVGSAFGLFFRGPLEEMVDNHGAAPPDELKRVWAAEAAKMRTGRHVGGGVLIGLGAVAAGAGAAIAAGAGDIEQEEREDWTTVLILGGGAFIGGGIAALIVESPVEQGYRAAFGQPSPTPISVGMAPAPGGASFALSGRF